jgi:hypothetical protein
MTLLLAATLKASGDAIIRMGLHSTAVWYRHPLFAGAADILFAYG